GSPAGWRRPARPRDASRRPARDRACAAAAPASTASAGRSATRAADRSRPGRWGRACGDSGCTEGFLSFEWPRVTVYLPPPHAGEGAQAACPCLLRLLVGIDHVAGL